MKLPPSLSPSLSLPPRLLRWFYRIGPISQISLIGLIALVSSSAFARAADAAADASASAAANAPSSEPAAAPAPTPAYHIYAGNTHSHTSITWSHGAQWMDPPGKPPVKGVSRNDDNSLSIAPKNKVLKPDWQKVQGTPAVHFALAKENGYDFYATTDHSQEETLHPTSPDNPAWLDEKRAAAAATDANFAAIAGFEFSENRKDGDGNGHINVFNTATYLNAMERGIDLRYLYKWLPAAPANGDGPVVASFNHPNPPNYNDWAYRDPAVTEMITMLEVINSNKYQPRYYESYIRALDKGWKVSPVSGMDNHGTGGISRMKARTFVLASEKTKTAILDAMKHRRTYAALNSTIQCRYTVNGAIMGSTLDAPAEFHFDISINDPDDKNPKNKITKIDIVTDGGKILQTHEPSPAAFTVNWTPIIANTTSKYFFVRVWSANGGDTPDSTPDTPVAWLAPVWTGR